MENDEYYAGTLPEVTITPSLQDKINYNTVRRNIPDDATRQNLLRMLDDYNSTISHQTV